MCRKPSGLDVQNRNRRPFLNVADGNKDDSTYTNRYEKEEDDTDDGENDSSPEYDAPLAPIGVIDSDIRNLQHN